MPPNHTDLKAQIRVYPAVIPPLARAEREAISITLGLADLRPLQKVTEFQALR